MQQHNRLTPPTADKPFASTQTTVVGEAADPEEVREFMEKRRLMLLDGVATGHPGSLSRSRPRQQAFRPRRSAAALGR